MKIKKIQFQHVRIPLRIRFAQANQDTQLSDSVIVCVQTDLGTKGYGEACPRTYVTGEDVASVRKCLKTWWEELPDYTFKQLEDIAKWTEKQLHNGFGTAAVCAIELALLDAWSQEYHQDLRSALRSERKTEEIQYSGVVPHGTWTQLAPRIAHFEFTSWKFKAYRALAPNLRRILDMKQQRGENTPIRMDANAGWTLAEAREQIEQGLQYGLSSFEQPLDPAEEAAATSLVDEYGDRAQIMADESLCTYADAQRLIATRQCNHFSIKISKNGGLLNSLKIYQLARENNIPCQLSAHYGETSILAAAGHLFALLVPELSACEGGLGTYLLREDIVGEPFMIDQKGIIDRPNMSFKGWPLNVEERTLNQYSLRTELWNTSGPRSINKAV